MTQMSTVFNHLTQTYDTVDKTSVPAELCDNAQCLADVFHIASIRAAQRELASQLLRKGPAE